jgi:hypothetical protein
MTQMPEDGAAYRFTVSEKNLMNMWKEDSTAFKTNYGLGILYYNQGVSYILATGKSNIDFDSIPEAVYNIKKSLSYLEIAYALDSTNENVIYALEGVRFALGDKRKLDYVDPQAFRVVEGDTINHVDEIGMLQGEWERLYPDGSFRCRGIYKDNKKDGYWERKYTNGNWQYQVHFKDGYPHGYGKWYYKSGQLKSEGNYENGYPNGLCKHYYPTGKLESKITYIGGNISGICKYYNEDGQLLREGFLNVEQREGEWKFYSDKGEHNMSVIYKAGIAIETIVK